MNGNTRRELMNLPPQAAAGFRCESCGHFFAIRAADITPIYFLEIKISCPKCKSVLDVWANVAIEARLARLLTSFLEQFVGKERTNRFLEQGATYSYQLNVLLPVFSSLRGVKPLPDLIRGHLNELRAYRNDISHKGVPSKKLDQNNMANCICAALFGFHYLNLIESSFLNSTGVKTGM